jgi:methionine aminotransferase
MNNNRITIKSKLPQVGTNIFTVMSGLAQEHQAINLSQGFPDFEVHSQLIALINKYYVAGYNQYAPMPGIMPLREAIAQKCNELYNANIDPILEVTVTPGGTEALFSAITALVHPGQEVIVFQPSYDSYIPSIVLAGATPIVVELKASSYAIDWEAVKRRINHNTKMIIINSPHNPTGAILSSNDLDQLYKLIEATDIVVLSDEVYEHIIFDNQTHNSVLAHKGLAARSMAVFSFGKTFHATGWKVGYIIAPQYLTHEFRKIHQFNVFSTNTPIQYALADYLKDKKNYNQLPDFYQKKRDYFASLLKQLPFDFELSNGSYFQCATYNQISKEKDTDFCKRMVAEAGVAAIPVSAFYNYPTLNNAVRFCFAKNETTILNAVTRLEKWLAK